MATKTVGLTLNINELTEDKTSTAWVSGKTVYGRTVTASTEVIQSAGVEYVTLTLSPSTYLDITNNLWCGVNVSDVSISIYSTQNVYYGSFTHSGTISVNREDLMDDQPLDRSASTIFIPKGTSLELRVRIKFTKDEPLTKVSSIVFLTPYTFNGTSDSATFTPDGSNYFSSSVSLGTITENSTLNPSQVEPNFHVTINKDTSTIGDIEVLPKGDTIDYQSQTCAFTISWSNIGSDYITISSSGGIDQVKDSNGNVITRTSRTGGSGSITVYADIQFNDGPAGNVYVKASATDANGNQVEDEGWYYQEGAPEPGTLNFVSGNLIVKGGTGQMWMTNFDIFLHTDSDMLNQYSWSEIGKIGASDKNVGPPTSYQHQSTVSSSANTLVIDSIGLSFSNAFQEPSRVVVVFPNGRGGTNSVELDKSSDDPYYFHRDIWATVTTVMPGETISWPDGNIEITAYL